MMEINIGDKFLNLNDGAGTYVTRSSGRKVYIFKTCEIIGYDGFLYGTNKRIYKAVDDKGRIIHLDDDDFADLRFAVIP